MGSGRRQKLTDPKVEDKCGRNGDAASSRILLQDNSSNYFVILFISSKQPNRFLVRPKGCILNKFVKC